MYPLFFLFTRKLFLDILLEGLYVSFDLYLNRNYHVGSTYLVLPFLLYVFFKGLLLRSTVHVTIKILH